MDNTDKKNPKWIAAVISSSGAAICELQPGGSYKMRATVETVNLAVTMVQALNDREDFLVFTPESDPV